MLGAQGLKGLGASPPAAAARCESKQLNFPPRQERHLLFTDGDNLFIIQPHPLLAINKPENSFVRANAQMGDRCTIPFAGGALRPFRHQDADDLLVHLNNHNVVQYFRFAKESEGSGALAVVAGPPPPPPPPLRLTPKKRNHKKPHSDRLKLPFTPEAAAAVKIDASELSSDIHASAAYRANLISVQTQRAVAQCLG